MIEKFDYSIKIGKFKRETVLSQRKVQLKMQRSPFHAANFNGVARVRKSWKIHLLGGVPAIDSSEIKRSLIS